MGNKGSTILHKAANEKDLSKLRWEVQRSPALVDVQEDTMGWTALHVAASNGSDAIVRELLARNAKHDISDKDGRTPLHLAAMNGRGQAVQDLLRRGASTAVRDKEGKAPYDYAVQRHPTVAALLGGPPPPPPSLPVSPTGQQAAPPPLATPTVPRPAAPSFGAVTPASPGMPPPHQVLPPPPPRAPPASIGIGGSTLPPVPYDSLPADSALPRPPPLPTAPHPAGPGAAAAAAAGHPAYDTAWYRGGGGGVAAGSGWPQPAQPGPNGPTAPPAAPQAPSYNQQQGYLPYPAVPGRQAAAPQQPQGGSAWPQGGTGAAAPEPVPHMPAAAPPPRQQAPSAPLRAPSPPPPPQAAPRHSQTEMAVRSNSGSASAGGRGATAAASGTPSSAAADLDWGPSEQTDWGGEPESPSHRSQPQPQPRPSPLRRGPFNPIASARYQLERLLGAGINQLGQFAGGVATAAAAAAAAAAAGGASGGGAASDTSNTTTAAAASAGSRFSSLMSPGGGGGGSVVGGRLYRYEQLRDATGGFSPLNKLGEGGYGPVYRGALDGIPVAVKVMETSEGAMQGRPEFEAEVAILSSLHHPHVVLLIGSCPEKGMLVYELMPNSSLEAHLFAGRERPGGVGAPHAGAGQGPSGGPGGPGGGRLGWRDRVKIAAQVASALLFLHSADTPIIHMDLKPANILLDTYWNAKLGDVGLARLAPTLAANNPVGQAAAAGGGGGGAPAAQGDTRLVGTFEYMDPEYLATGRYSERSDVFALGMVMLQLLTGREGGQVVSLVEEARRQPLGFAACIDPRSGAAGPWPATEAAAFADLALACVKPRPQDRPDLRAVILPTLRQLEARTQLYDTPPSPPPPLVSTPSQPQPYQQQQQGVPPHLAPEDVVPQMFICPITQDVMEDPVVAADGYTYERLAIQEWIRRAGTSPLTNMPLPHTSLVENRAMRSAIIEWRERTEAQVVQASAPPAPPAPPPVAPPQRPRQAHDDTGW